MLAPKYLDRYLGTHTYDQQSTQTPVAATRKDNLMQPVEGLHRTRGSISGEAVDSATTMAGPVARLIPSFIAGLTGLSLGVAMARMSERKTRSPLPCSLSELLP
jgi:hypothetical protein